MKILHILNHSVPHTDGYCIRSAQIVNTQKRTGMDPVVVTSPHHEPRIDGPVETIDGVRYYRTRAMNGKRIPILHEMRAVLALANRIQDVVQIETPDVLHAHSPCTWGAAACIAARRCRLPFVYEVRGLWQGDQADNGSTRLPMKYRLGRWLESRVAARARRVTAISTCLKSDLVQRGTLEEKIRLVPNGVDADVLRPLAADADLINDLGISGKICLGYIGSFYPFEGITDLVGAMPKIVASLPEAVLILVGGGIQENEVRRLIADLKVEEHVRYVGRVPHSDVARYYSVIDVMVYPRPSNRITETVTPLKPLEALAMQKAVLSSRVGGLCELLNDDVAKFFEPGDRNDLSLQAVQLLSDPELRKRLGKSGRRYVMENRSWETVVSNYSQIYEQTIGQTLI